MQVIVLKILCRGWNHCNNKVYPYYMYVMLFESSIIWRKWNKVWKIILYDVCALQKK